MCFCVGKNITESREIHLAEDKCGSQFSYRLEEEKEEKKRAPSAGFDQKKHLWHKVYE